MADHVPMVGWKDREFSGFTATLGSLSPFSVHLLTSHAPTSLLHSPKPAHALPCCPRGGSRRPWVPASPFPASPPPRRPGATRLPHAGGCGRRKRWAAGCGGCLKGPTFLALKPRLCSPAGGQGSGPRGRRGTVFPGGTGGGREDDALHLRPFDTNPTSCPGSCSRPQWGRAGSGPGSRLRHQAAASPPLRRPRPCGAGWVRCPGGDGESRTSPGSVRP